uniref:Uncharacterized protein n=1 Tax=Caenorhabditis japonica TaxID=281687 RepID=A0A8R1HK73_CAEJA
MEKNTLTTHLTPEEEVAKCAHLLARNDRVYHALSRLRVLHVSLDTLRRHNVKRLAMRYSSNKELAGAVRVVVEMMEKLEEEERLEGKLSHMRTVLYQNCPESELSRIRTVPNQNCSYQNCPESELFVS